MSDLATQLERQRAAATQRGRIVRSLVAHGGTARTDAYFDALADAGAFNARHPELAIPAPFPLIRRWPPECSTCGGDGSVILRVSTSIPMTGAPTIAAEAQTCPPCQGSGFVGVVGIGTAARAAYARG